MLRMISRRGFLGTGAALLAAGSLPAQQPPAGRVASLPYPVPQRRFQPPAGHPLIPALDLLDECSASLRQVRDYTCTFTKRERIKDRLTPYESMLLKVREQPFSVYLYCLGPEKPRGQEAIYVANQNDGEVVVHGMGLKRIAGTLVLSPQSERMMEGNLHPITNIGLSNLVAKLRKIWEHETQYGECQVQAFTGAQLDGRSAHGIQVVHPTPRKEFRFHIVQLLVDDQWRVPLRMTASSWPQTPGGEPLLIEEYNYREPKFNTGLTDLDFDPRNPAYGYE